MRGDPYGSHRVISPKGLLPQAAERVDNSPTICSNEILIDVIALQPTATAFGRIKQECGGDVNRIAQEIQKIVDERGMRQVSDAGALQPIVDQVLANCPDQAQQYRDGNQKVIGFLVGQCMKVSRGTGNPKLFNELLRASLS